MTNNTPDYEDNLYFEEKKMDCKNCPYTDEYCASGDCERNADVSKTLTEQWEKGELPPRYYYIKDNKNKIEIDEYVQWYKERGQKSGKSFIYYKVMEVLAPVPSYEEWKDLKSKLQLKETAYDFDTARLEEQNAQLKDLLKECKIYVENFIEGSTLINEHHISYILLQRIKEVLK